MRTHQFKTLVAVFIFALVFGMQQTQAIGAEDEQHILQELSKAFVKIAQEVGETVVAIQTQRRFRADADREENRRDFFFDDFFFNVPEGEQRRRILPNMPLRRPERADFGSGILIDNQGHIATITHLVEDSDEIYVILKDGVRLKAEVVGSDEGTGISVIKVDTDALSSAKLGDSDEVAIGELVVSIGHLSGGEQAVFSGMIAGVGRNRGKFSYENWIEIDTDLRFGFGGSATANTKGEVIGMNVARSEEGRSFVIPINIVQYVAEQLIEHGEVVRGWLGVGIQEVDADLAEGLNLDKPMGVLINRILEDTPASEAGLQRGDVIIAIDGRAIKNTNHLRYVIAMHKPDSSLTLTFMRDGEKQDISVTLGKRPDEGVAKRSDLLRGRQQPDWRGLSLQNLTEELAEAFGYMPKEGVLIAGVAPGSPAAKAGEGNQKLRRGDLILEVDHIPVQNVEEFKDVVKRNEGSNLLQVKRDGRTWFVVVK